MLMENVENVKLMMIVPNSHAQHVNLEFVRILNVVQTMNVPTTNTAVMNMSVRMVVMKILIV